MQFDAAGETAGKQAGSGARRGSDGTVVFLRLRHPGSLSPALGQAAFTTRAEGRRAGRTLGSRALVRWPSLRIGTICPIDIEGLYGGKF